MQIYDAPCPIHTRRKRAQRTVRLSESDQLGKPEKTPQGDLLEGVVAIGILPGGPKLGHVVTLAKSKAKSKRKWDRTHAPE